MFWIFQLLQLKLIFFLTKHNVVWGIAMHFSLFQVSGEDLHVATATVDLLLMLDCKLNDQRLPLVAEGIKTGGDGVETGILACLQT